MKIFTTLCCAALLFAGASFAQSRADHMTVRFASPVMVGETRLPAGNYDIQVKRGASDTTILVLRSENGPAIGALATHIADNDLDNEGNASIVLNRKGNDLQLSRVMFGDHTGYQLSIAE